MDECMAHDIKVSIVIPVYNAEKHIEKCINSIINQTYSNIELIIIDDASTDNSKKIISDYERLDNRITVISRDKNCGPAMARNIGVEKADGEFIMFIDSDDFITKNTIEVFIKRYKQYNCDLIIGNFYKVIDNLEIKNEMYFDINNQSFNKDIKLLNREDIFNYTRNYLKDYNKYVLFSYCWGRIFKLSIIKENNITFNINLKIFEDVIFNLEYLKYIDTILYVNDYLYYYTIHSNDSSASRCIVYNYYDSMVSMKIALKELFLMYRNIDMEEINKESSYAIISLTVAYLVIYCRQINLKNIINIYTLVNKILKNTELQMCLKLYSPQKGHSKLIPFLMKYKTTFLVIIACKYRAFKRYKGGN